MPSFEFQMYTINYVQLRILACRFDLSIHFLSTVQTCKAVACRNKLIQTLHRRLLGINGPVPDYTLISILPSDWILRIGEICYFNLAPGMIDECRLPGSDLGVDCSTPVCSVDAAISRQRSLTSNLFLYDLVNVHVQIAGYD